MRLLERIRDYFGHTDVAGVEAEADALLALGPLTRDLCAVCAKPLHLHERVEVLVGPIDFDSEFGGSSALLATYCTEHAPEGT